MFKRDDNPHGKLFKPFVRGSDIWYFAHSYFHKGPLIGRTSHSEKSLLLELRRSLDDLGALITYALGDLFIAHNYVVLTGCMSSENVRNEGGAPRALQTPFFGFCRETKSDAAKKSAIILLAMNCTAQITVLTRSNSGGSGSTHKTIFLKQGGMVVLDKSCFIKIDKFGGPQPQPTRTLKSGNLEPNYFRSGI